MDNHVLKIIKKLLFKNVTMKYEATCHIFMKQLMNIFMLTLNIKIWLLET